MTTCNELEEQNKYIIGKAIELKDRLGSYNKVSNFKVVYHKSFKTENDMGLAEKLILNKLSQYREKANIDRFVLPVDKDINFFTDVFDYVHSCFS